MTFVEGVVQIVNSPNFTKVIVTAFIAVTVAWLLVKSGLLTVHSKYVTMGVADKEHAIMRKQLIYAKQACDAFVQYIPQGEDYNEWRGKCVAELVYDEMVDWVVLNHIEDTEDYISLRQTAVWNIILAHVWKPEHKSEEFRQVVFKHVEQDIKALVRIRKCAK